MTKAMGVQWPGKKVNIHIGDIFLKKHHDAYFSVNFQVWAPHEITHSPASPFWLLPTSSVNQREMLTASPEALKIGANFPSTAEKTQRPACRQSLYEAGDQGLSGTSRPSLQPECRFSSPYWGYGVHHGLQKVLSQFTEVGLKPSTVRHCHFMFFRENKRLSVKGQHSTKILSITTHQIS